MFETTNQVGIDWIWCELAMPSIGEKWPVVFTDSNRKLVIRILQTVTDQQRTGNNIATDNKIEASSVISEDL